MDGDVCKIKQILELNASEFDENFIQFLLQDSQNLKQLSKLINALEKVKAFSKHTSLIHEPSNPEPDLISAFDVEIHLEIDSKTDIKVDEKQDVVASIDLIYEYTQEQEKQQIDLNSSQQETEAEPETVDLEQPITASNEQVSENVIDRIVVETNTFEPMEKVPT